MLSELFFFQAWNSGGLLQHTSDTWFPFIMYIFKWHIPVVWVYWFYIY